MSKRFTAQLTASQWMRTFVDNYPKIDDSLTKLLV